MGRSRTGRPDILGPDTNGRPVARRDFLRGLAIAAGAGTTATSLLRPATARAATTFPDGVKAGDPQPNGAVLWTRITPPLDGQDVAIVWTVARDAAMQQVVRGGITYARAGENFMAKVKVRGLAPDGWYHYRFDAADGSSPVGRLRTAPRPGVMPDRLRYAFASCQQRNASYYNAHLAIANENVDFFMHLGDYIYVHDFADLTVDDYRRRWALFQANPLLQELQAKVPIVAMWDDGEFYNGVDNTGDPGRLANAKQAFFEHMPVVPGRAQRCYRAFRWGKLADVLVADVRSYRDPEVPANTTFAGLFDGQDTDLPGGNDMFLPGRTTLGERQKRWLEGRLNRRRAIWKMVGVGYNVTPLKIQDYETQPGDVDPPNNEGIYVSNEAFDDYQVERKEILSLLARRDNRNIVFTSGHTHVYFASELQPDFDDPASPVVAFDFTCGSLTADPPATEIAPIEVLRVAEQVLVQQNAPSLKFVDLVAQGYGVVDVTPEEVIVEFRGIDTFDLDAEPTTTARFRVVRDGRAMERLA